MERPPPPPRSYTQDVAFNLQDALSATLLDSPLSSSPAPASDACIPPSRPRSNTVASTDSRVRRRRSADQLRLPPGHRGEESDGGEGVRGEAARSGGRGGGAGEIQDGGLIPPPMLRRTTSADLLVLDRSSEGELDDDSDLSSDAESFRYRPPSIASTTTSNRSSRRGVRVEDWSDRQSSSFVRDVRIKGYHAVGSEGSGFVLFDIEIETVSPDPATPGTTIRIHKRYSAFVRLRADLNRSFPRFRPLIPRLPPKSSFAKYRPSFLERRRQHLAYWLSSVLLHPILGGCPDVRQWILD